MSGKIGAEARRADVGGVPKTSSMAGLIEQIKDVDVVSFDLFDTLFVRPLVDAEDAFDILGETQGVENFRDLRRAAQTRAFQRMHAQGRGEITLDGIYECFDALCERDRVRQAEFELELELTRPNSEMLEIFNQARALGKQVVITSDMYLERPFFEALLRRHAIAPTPLFISADRNATKRDHGALFDIIAAELGVAHARILHIGDNEIADIKMPAAKGLRTWRYVEARKPPRRKGLSTTASLARALVRLHPDAAPPGSLRELGFVWGGPATLGFLEWIAAQSRVDDVEHILFLARDGHVLQQLAERHRGSGAVRDLPRSSYLLGSRVAFVMAGMNEENFGDFLPFLLSGSNGLAPSEFLERLGVPAPAERVLADVGLGQAVISTPADQRKMGSLLHAWRWEILKVCRRNRRGLLRHVIDLGVRPGQRVAIVDVGWNGTTQEAFEDAMRSLMPLTTVGYYFCLRDSEECRRRMARMRMKALVGMQSVTPQLLDAVYVNRVVGEIVFSAPHDSVIGFADGLTGVMPVMDAGRAAVGDLAAMICEIEAGVLDFAEKFLPWRDGLGLQPDCLGMALPLLEFMADGEWAQRPILKRIKNFDAWASSRNLEVCLTDYAVRGLYSVKA